jgi:enoyl-CoA hydratase/carnithine racemase
MKKRVNMNPVKVTYEGDVALLTMQNGENRHNPTFASAMLDALNAILDNANCKALVITSNDEKCFSLGIDTDWLMPAMKAKQFDEIKAFMHGMDDVFKTLLLFPIPVIAAINGHAFGNGAILACACDFRFMRADKGFFCFPEVDLSIPFLPGMIEFVKKAMPYHRFNEMKLSGRRVSGKELERDHVVEKSFDTQDTLMEGALNYAKTFNKKRAIFGEHKKRLHKHIIDTIESENKPLIESLTLVVE